MRKSWKAVGLAAALAWLSAGCGRGGGAAVYDGQDDLAYVQGKGTLVVGVTDYAPMDYQVDGAWAGFDAEMAASFAESLGVDAQFQEIDWDRKTKLLEDGSIDCVWNGMTFTQELSETISCSDPYLSNAQVVVLRKEEAEQYRTVEACQHLLFTAEAGSAGEDILKEMRYRYTVSSVQKEAFESVRDRKADAAVADLVMASCLVGEGREFEGLVYLPARLNDETFCVGFRRESDLTAALNAFLKAADEDGSLKALAEKYGIEGAVLEQ